VTSGPEKPAGLDEFGEIARLFRPLTRGAPEARGLVDDAAVLAPRAGVDLVLTKDAIVEGVHFLAGDPPETVARKLLRVNLSDLASEGASPWAFLLAVSWSSRCDRAFREAFAAGLAEDAERYGVVLLGGDTTTTPGPFAASATLIGQTPHGTAVSRAGAREGDLLFVTGTIGDGWLGLRAALGEDLGLEAPRVEFLADRYRLPQPRVQLIEPVRDLAHAAADVSDGLVADARRIADASGLAATIDLGRVPLSRAARAWAERRADPLSGLVALATGGDDYELAVAVPPSRTAAFQHAADRAGVPVHAAGRFEAGEGARVTYEGAEVSLAREGWTHG
jgi:thiamine-monophosphate kinase